ncbi:serine/threonine protein kinase [bacterium]|nr:serine/threonine protein kinase [bacterium]
MAPDRISSYQITGELGKGSMGVVYEGRPDDGSAAVAIKVFYPDTKLTADETSVLLERFEREGQALSQLNHRNVVRVLEVGKTDEFDYIVMEKLEGFNLKDLLQLGTRFTLADTFDIMLQLLAGLSACHRTGLVHRDVKPANLVRSSEGVIKLTDFGIARIITDETLSRTGTIVGTPNYMSPEQIRGEEVDARSDLFSAGVLMYELLSGKKPFDGPDMTAIMYNITNIHPPSPRFYNGALPLEIEEIVFQALAKDPAQRFSSADELTKAIRDLEQALRYHENSQAFLSALPAPPDVDADAGGLAVPADPSNLAAAAGASGKSGQHSISGSSAVSLAAAGGGIVSGKVYCVDCGMDNDAASDFCVRCMRPLLKRDIVNQLAAKQAKMLYRVGRGDYFFMTCLSVIIVAVVILILYLFFRGPT